ncbi:MAG: tRNA pseudouridine(38-40) synthase TruA [Hyphomonadaceae bacterium]|nr:tRNA pseudouridine(38-40) synthase TruA [Hyphomonadaceae bacterium]MBC6413089.1 tRNA pseudouridine(38-40) synthase TruA [Hyphomonadaceae bacterium]
MPRFKITIEYDGRPYSGWQRQDHAPSVQGAIEAAIKKLVGADTTLHAAGRTDAGVHALGQVAHFDTAKQWRPDQVQDALNYHLGDHPVSILKAEAVDAEFHARFDAVERSYLYRILPRRARLALDRGRVWRVPCKIDVEAMHAAAQTLVGEHDFTTFRDTQCQAKSPVRRLEDIRVITAADEVRIHVRARSFLHKQVRSIAGTLTEVGRGNRMVEDVKKALDARDRKACGSVAPPDGLYLLSVSY